MVSLILPCYWLNEDLIEMTIECLNSLNETTDDEPEQVLIIDDGSPVTLYLEDDTDFVQRFDTIHLEKNKGYAGAVNAGLFHAEGDIIVVGNNDLVFTENWLRGLLKVLEEGFDIATCWTSDQGYKLDDVIKEGGKFGSIFAMNRMVYDTIGGFDEQFRGYFSDADYARRAAAEGFRVGMNHGLVIGHKAKATYKQTDPTDSEYLRSMRLFEAKWGEVD